jgi:hypothetical protein
MAVTPMEIRRRPFSVEPFTNVMLPDGIFDTALKKQRITCFYTNMSGATLHQVTIYLEGVGDPGIVPVAQTYVFPEIKAGASVRVSWLADFEHGTPGKKLVSIIAQAQGMSLVRALKNIFVSQTTRDPVTGEFTCVVPEGTVKVSKLEMIGPRDEWRPCSDRRKDCLPDHGPWVPSKITMTVHPNPAYAGTHGDLPFNDPWWKIVAWIIAAIAAIVAIVAAALGAGTASTTVGGTFDVSTGSVSCCTPKLEGLPEFTVAGVASAIATGAAIVGMTDDKDCFRRGQEATPPGAGELTVAEKVEATFTYPGGAPNAGVAYPVHIVWKYERTTNARVYTHEAEETPTNTHVSDGVILDVPATHHAFAKPLVIKARFMRKGGKLFAGEDLYAFCMLASPDGLFFFVPLLDDGIDEDAQANDGTYTGSIHLEKLYRILLQKGLKLEGLWKVYVFAQDVNDATPDMLPEIAATRIGGFVVASALHITFDPTLPCPLQAQATVMVVA